MRAVTFITVICVGGKYGGYANHGRDAGDIIYDLDRPVYKMSISRGPEQVAGWSNDPEQ